MLTKRLKINPADKVFKRVVKDADYTSISRPSAIRTNASGQKCPCGGKFILTNLEELSGNRVKTAEQCNQCGKSRMMIKAQDTDSEGFDVRNIEQESIDNNNFRKVVFTGKTMQLVLMSLLPNEDIGEETHDKVDQFFRIEEGSGEAVVEGESNPIEAGSSILIKQGTKHNIIAGNEGLKLYTIYAPPNHPPDRVQKTKAEAMAEEEK
jgi:mannose-6-phosphate isomerase-like protein (cupin superfamily)